ncbi:MAG: hypothetical protein E6H46_10040 [Betaproteobacteria bacterium]|nr:MAG: hypothetical protein E6H46_10040 [Betaproteobacteria bacterium]
MRDVGLLAARREALPRLGRNDAIRIVDQEVPAPARGRQLPVRLIVERVGVRRIAEGLVRKIDLQHFHGVVKGDPVAIAQVGHDRFTGT